ncbi:ABC transporter substrate-binding protein [Azospirillum doebereinerae]
MTQTKSGKGFEASRRSLLKTMGTAAVAAPMILKFGRAAAADPLVLVTWGGAYQELVESIFAKPFTAASGIPMRVVSGPDLAKAKAQVKTGNVEWDLFDGTGPMITGGETEKLWEPLDKGIVDAADLTVPMRDFSMPFMSFSGGIGFVLSKAGGNHPKTFADFWNVKDFPGRRGLRTRVSETLEMALLADGVDPKKLYPLDVERAFKALDRIKPSVAKWIDQTPQTISLLQNNEVDWVYTYSGRVVTAQQNGIDVGYSFSQNLLMSQYLAILKGSRRKEAAVTYLRFVTGTKVQAQFAEAYASLPILKSSFPLLSDKAKAKLPDLSDPKNVFIDESWWAANFVALDRRFKEWLAT